MPVLLFSGLERAAGSFSIPERRGNMRFAPSVFLLAAWISMGTGCDLRPAAKHQPKQPVTQAPTPAPITPAPTPAPVTPALTPAPEASPARTEDKPTPTPIDRNAQVVVIGYHRLVDKVRHPDTEITPQDFEAQMQQIRDAGISVISMEDFLAWRRGEKNIPPKSAIITLDDGWNTTYNVAWPILRKFGYPFTLFIYTDYVKGGPKSGGGSLTWGQLGELRDAGASIESHTISHRDLRGRKNRRATAEYEEWLWKELAGSKEQLEEQLGISVEALALPYGRHDEHVREIAKKAGYEAVFTVEGQKITYATPLDSVGRYIIDSSKPKVFAEAIRFGGPSDDSTSPAVAAIDFSAIETQPPNGAKVSEEFPLLKASLAPFGNIDPKSVQMRISGIGLVAAEYDAASKSVSFKLKQNLQEKDYIVIVSMQADGRRLETRWSFTFTRVKGED
jgi:peptidoglycan/xylan/chitin deacetylase (PgdA/CDA1 family)